MAYTDINQISLCPYNLNNDNKLSPYKAAEIYMRMTQKCHTYDTGVYIRMTQKLFFSSSTKQYNHPKWPRLFFPILRRGFLF